MKICFLDLETTGFDPKKDSIIEIAFLIRDERGEIIEKYDEVIIPDKSELTPFVSNLTGISAEEIAGSTLNFVDIKDKIQDLIGDAVIIGHNIDFDIKFLIANGVDVSGNKRIDTHELSRILLPQEESFALEVLAEKYGFVHADAHRAMSDVEANIELYDFLVDKIGKLPTEFFGEIREFLETKTDWFAKDLFFKASGQADNNRSTDQQNNRSIKENYQSQISDLNVDFSENRNYFFRAGNSVRVADFQRAICEKAEDEKFLIITPKLDFYKGIEKFATPEVLFDASKLAEFSDSREKLDNGETTFFLKCKHRAFLGHRGLHYFDLFFKERTLWNELCADEDSEIFMDSVSKRKDEKVLTLTPAAFFRFRDLDLFKGRTLIIDEAEIFAEQLLFAPSKEFPLQKFLDNKSDDVSVPAHFFVSSFCRDVIEKKLSHAIMPFPQKLLFGDNEFYPEFAEQLLALGDDEVLKNAADILNPETKDHKIVRWLRYFPDNGNLIFGKWSPDDWRDMKGSIESSFPKKMFFNRSELSSAFLRIFLGIDPDAVENRGEVDEFFPNRVVPKFEVPAGLKSASSGEYLDFCAEKVLEIAKEGVPLAVNFSSLDTLRNTLTRAIELPGMDKFLLKGEKASGGDGKVLSMIKGQKDLVLFYQKLVRPELEDLNFKTVVIQKFPFNPPHPLLEKMEKVLDGSNLSFWNIWVIPQVAANLSRRISSFSSAEKIIFIDPRENTGWGKNILKSAGLQ
ncbi:MAG: 3'-5' exonuclease [Candidatus Peregrinibacteria bacterium]|nr:3'-5' exonuclease [Candidatus Peregrinibacteria bacterium]